MRILYNDCYFSSCYAMLVNDTGNQLMNLAVQLVFTKILPNSEELVNPIYERIERTTVQHLECIPFSDAEFRTPVLTVAFYEGELIPPRSHQIIIQATAIERKISDQLFTDHPIAVLLAPLEITQYHISWFDGPCVNTKTGDGIAFPLVGLGVDKTLCARDPHVNIL